MGLDIRFIALPSNIVGAVDIEYKYEFSFSQFFTETATTTRRQRHILNVFHIWKSRKNCLLINRFKKRLTNWDNESRVLLKLSISRLCCDYFGHKLTWLDAYDNRDDVDDRRDDDDDCVLVDVDNRNFTQIINLFFIRERKRERAADCQPQKNRDWGGTDS